jgi:hypothetical protein
MALKTIKLRDYDRLPVIYDQDGGINEVNLKLGDIYLMREPETPKDVGEVVSVYKIVHLTEYGNESKIEMLRIE